MLGVFAAPDEERSQADNGDGKEDNDVCRLPC